MKPSACRLNSSAIIGGCPLPYQMDVHNRQGSRQNGRRLSRHFQRVITTVTRYSLRLPECSALKSGMPSTPKDDSLAVDDELLLAVLEGCLDNPRISLGPVMAIAGNQSDAIAVPFNTEAVAVILDFMERAFERSSAPPRGCNLSLSGRGSSTRQARARSGDGPSIWWRQCAGGK